MFQDEMTNNEVDTWAREIWCASLQELPEPVIDTSVAPILVTVKDLINNISDPSENEGPTVSYRGKLLPSPWCDSIQCIKETDNKMVSIFLEYLGKGEPLIDEIQKAWELSKNSFHIAKSKKMQQYPTPDTM